MVLLELGAASAVLADPMVVISFHWAQYVVQDSLGKIDAVVVRPVTGKLDCVWCVASTIDELTSDDATHLAKRPVEQSRL